jgi:Zinc-binding dehydrogenase
MVLDVGVSDMLSIAQTVGIVGTLLIALFLSRREVRELSIDIETKVLSDLDEKVHRLEEHLLERPELARVINNVQSLSPDRVYAFDVLNVFSHAYDMHERKVLNENEWFGWVQWMRTCFRLGTIKEYWYCVEGATWTYNAVERDARTPTQGGYSNKIVVDENYVLRIPDNLPMDGAAPLLCAGITLYSPLMHWKAGPGKKVAIIGLGGLGHIGVKIAHALGAEVTVLSQSLKKQEEAKKMGADNFYATSDRENLKKLRGYFDIIINTVSVELDLNKYMKLLDVDGTMIVVGLP